MVFNLRQMMDEGGSGRVAGPATPINTGRVAGTATPINFAPVGNSGARQGVGDLNWNYTPPAQNTYSPPPGYGGGISNQLPATPSYGIGAPTGGGYGGAPAPAPQSKPVMSDSDWLAGDSDYQDQMTQYGTALTDFLARLTKQKNDFTQDYNVAKQGLDRNETMGLQNLGEDFTSRGLANSGLFANARKEAQTNFQNQRDGMNTARDRAMADFTSQETDKRNSTKMAQDNARKSSLSRMAMQQAF